ncbi:AzlD family protein [Pseudovibrio sp. Ad37]|uniref:AzlD family protein n=1 Tax=Pseudovibrio sp. Ad37 TaxID=989422 RepID=UPI0007AEAECE|nr:AzlD domain-containing protein [Pseudovibrio sp. Ad37]KZL14678.1 Branched-chain amino acid transport protein (AzlD) [Pseudovibrio sp. Ad37]
MMSEVFAVDPLVLFTIVAMAAGTYLTRIAGLVLTKFVTFSGRTEAALQAVPPAILMSVVAPTAFATGIAETAATAITAIAALRLPMLAAMTLGVVSVVVLRLALSVI